MLANDIDSGRVKPNQLIFMDQRPVKILSIRDTINYPVGFITRKRRPEILRGRYLLTVQNYLDNNIHSVYANTVLDYKPVRFYDKIVLMIKKAFNRG